MLLFFISLNYLSDHKIYVFIHFNILPPDLAANDDENIRIEGPVKHRPSGIDFSYRETHPEYFTKAAGIVQMDEIANGRGNDP